MKRLLKHPALHHAKGMVIGEDACRRKVVEKYLRPKAGQALLDIGCGTGGMVPYVPEVMYTGVEQSGAYVAYAQAKYPQAHFIKGDALQVALDGKFDLCLLWGVLHHLNDEDAARLLRRVPGWLTEQGRVLVVEPCRVPGKNLVSQWMIHRDCGHYVRDMAENMTLLQGVFPFVKSALRQDLLRVPYSFAILEAGHGHFGT